MGRGRVVVPPRRAPPLALGALQRPIRWRSGWLFPPFIKRGLRMGGLPFNFRRIYLPKNNKLLARGSTIFMWVVVWGGGLDNLKYAELI